jgi:phage/plasmid-associated DNA primase
LSDPSGSFILDNIAGKRVNIDDDMGTSTLKDVGRIKTLLTGNGIFAGVKYGKGMSILSEDTPKFLFAGNQIPPIIHKEGLIERLRIFVCNNVIPVTKRTGAFQQKIRNGEYDNELEWLIFTAITYYHKFKEEGIQTEHMIKQTAKLMELGSDPLKYIIEMIFQEPESVFNDTNYLRLKEVKVHLKHTKVILEKEGSYEASRINLKDQSLIKASVETGYKFGFF